MRPVVELYQNIGRTAGSDHPGPACSHRNAIRLFVGCPSLGKQAMRADKIAVVAAENDECIVSPAIGIECIENHADIMIELLAVCIIVAKTLLELIFR